MGTRGNNDWFRLDALRSVVKNVADAATESVNRLEPVERVRTTVENLTRQQFHISEDELTRVVVAQPQVRQATVQVQSPNIFCDVETTGHHIAFGTRVQSVFFASGGAKELVFSVQGGDPALAEPHVGRLAVAVALHMWGPLFGVDRVHSTLPCDRQGETLRYDLQNIQEFKRKSRHTTWGKMADLIKLDHIAAGEGQLIIQLRNPLQ